MSRLPGEKVPASRAWRPCPRGTPGDTLAGMTMHRARTAGLALDGTSAGSRASTLIGLSAAAAVVIYVAATVLGGLLDPGYSHMSMHVSELTSSHAPNRALLAALYTGYNIALGGMALGLLRSVKWSRSLPIASWSLLATAGVGVLLVSVFPQDSYGYPSTTPGAMHIVLAGVAALLFVVAIVTMARAFRRDPGWTPLAPISTVAAVAVLVTGLAGAIGAATASGYMGLLQRLNLGTIMAWLSAVAWHALRPWATSRQATGTQ